MEIWTSRIQLQLGDETGEPVPPFFGNLGSDDNLTTDETDDTAGDDGNFNNNMI